MRYAVVSDIHANRQAFRAVLTDIRSLGVDKIFSLGDLVGYGPSPGVVLEKAYEHIHYFILGNHDAVIAEKLDPACFNDNARRIIDWTAKNLDNKAKSFFSKHPLMIEADNCILSHGEIENPGRFGYIFEEADAQISFNSCLKQLIFVGHSHLPGIFVRGNSGSSHLLQAQDFTLEAEKRYIINPGSVGQPRDNDFRASYCIHDTEQNTIEFRKVPFDIDAYRQDLKRNSLSEETSYFLFVADQKEPPQLRESLDFSPLSKANYVKTEQDTVLLSQKVKQLRKNQTILTIAAALAILLVVYLTYLHTTRQPEVKNVVKEIVKEVPPPLLFTEYKSKLDKTIQYSRKGKELIKMPEHIGVITPQKRLKDWTVRLNDPACQQVSIDDGNNVPVIKLSSGSMKKMALIYRPVAVKKGQRFEAAAKLKKEQLQQVSNVLMRLDFQPENGDKMTIQYKAVSEFKRFKKGNWAYVKCSSRKPIPDKGLLYYTITGRFAGNVLIKECGLKRK